MKRHVLVAQLASIEHFVENHPDYTYNDISEYKTLVREFAIRDYLQRKHAQGRTHAILKAIAEMQNKN